MKSRLEIILEKLPKQELSSHKIELALVDDIEKTYNKIKSDADNLSMGLIKAANEVDGINQNMIGFGLIGGGFFIVMIATVGYLIATKIKGGGTALTAMTALSAFRR